MGEWPLSPLQRAKLKMAFEESDLPYQVDILDWAALRPDFRDNLLVGSQSLLHRSTRGAEAAP